MDLMEQCLVSFFKVLTSAIFSCSHLVIIFFYIIQIHCIHASLFLIPGLYSERYNIDQMILRGPNRYADSAANICHCEELIIKDFGVVCLMLACVARYKWHITKSPNPLNPTKLKRVVIFITFEKIQ